MPEQYLSVNHAKVEARAQFSRASAKEKRWMAVVWTVGDGGKLTMDRTTFDFPLADVAAALGLLAADMRKESSGLDTAPLPDAPDFGKSDLHVADSIGAVVGESCVKSEGTPCAINS